jgi:hypothetical protein
MKNQKLQAYYAKQRCSLSGRPSFFRFDLDAGITRKRFSNASD